MLSTAFFVFSNPFTCRVTHKVLFVTHTGGKCLIVNLIDAAGVEIRLVAWSEKIDKFINKFVARKLFMRVLYI